MTQNAVVETYSKLADQYDDDANCNSCWGRASAKWTGSLAVQETDGLVLDIGCGTGRTLEALASKGSPATHFIGLDPAPNMRERAVARTRHIPNILILDGRFEEIPLETGSVDYLYSLFAFHWTTDLECSVREIARVLQPRARMDLIFIGRANGREFIDKTTPIFLKYMGPAALLDSARMRKQLTRQGALELFGRMFPASRLSVEESFETYYDTLDGHWGWWVRIEGHFVAIPPEKRSLCDREVRNALASLREPRGIPYTIHQLHVKLRNNSE